MNKVLLSVILLGSFALSNAQNYVSEDGFPEDELIMNENGPKDANNMLLTKKAPLRISVLAQGVAPADTISPAQAYVMAKRAATVEAYRLIAEKVNGVVVEGKDTIKNMVVQRSVVKTRVSAMIKNASIVETTFKNGMCEVEMEIELNYNQFD